ncbi:hypothetical protein LEP1GSC019_4394 [Leptospira interrogans serovar Pyrogenes str. 2006006960]|nr:hypothetical protein LEP1GSC007_3391 [Leptospira interrogans serovar Bulgarica str. Mallika]EKR17693.1 hypothetical protein LEP1GSC019_4394 [Leptospira interrogans serovar Pyrogenes str. 2006006960]EMN55427.1 hypothetical protein LEP1GSC089_3243 [Leptospira interrogans serovar Autumnalis str. LP101]EMN79767.1 hypothetical protein LEP1GSC106_3495 [Leptospira interrogans serovar Grippotyphosa str. UI 12764]
MWFLILKSIYFLLFCILKAISKKHKRRKKEDPIYNISNKDDRY